MLCKFKPAKSFHSKGKRMVKINTNVLLHVDKNADIMTQCTHAFAAYASLDFIFLPLFYDS